MGLKSTAQPVYGVPRCHLPVCFYPSDLSDQEWEILSPLIPPAKPGGRPSKWPMHEILNATFNLLSSGCL
jgi:hypothetical protein